jgi:MoaA/NifB/PqqE/SkfB family radical SAM enzyme
VARRASIVTNQRCNQNCTYCVLRSPTDDLAAIAPAAVRARIEAAIAAGASEIVLTGGEPTMRADLAALVAHARNAGAERVALETNATLLDPERARALAGAGLGLARVNLAGWSDAIDGVTRDPGGFRRTLEGLAALAGAGVTLEILATVARSTRERLAELPAGLATAPFAPAVEAIEVAVARESPDPAEIPSYEEASASVRALDAAARVHGIPVRFHPAQAIPPCVFGPKERVRLASLYSLAPGAPPLADHTHVDACRSCAVADRCSGLPDAYLARFPLPAMSPIADDKTRRRLTMVGSVKEQIARELVTSSISAGDGGTPLVDAVVRINFQCNQACTFCFVSTHLPAAADEAIERAIADAGARGERIVLSGGEPTLNPRLPDYVRLARSASRHEVHVQTNAVRLDDAALVRSLADSGVAVVFVSLHGASAGVSDEVTQAPGTFVRTVAGLDNLARAGLRVAINFVVCTTNYRELPDAVRLVADRWPQAGFIVSFVAASTDLVPRDRSLIPRYSEVMPFIAEAVRVARARGVRVTGFDSMCGVPLCLVPSELEAEGLFEKPAGFDDGEFSKADACRGCAYETRCWGIRRGYAALYGTGELRTVAGDASPRAS